MQSIRTRGLRPLTHVVLASLCFTLPACIEDIVVPPPGDEPYPPDVDAGGPPPVPPSENPQSVYYDPLVFATVIQPQLDAASCALVGCHHPTTPILGFGLNPTPAFGSFEMWSNLQVVTSFVDLAQTPFVPEASRFYQRATDSHAGGVVQDAEALRAWLEEAAARFAGQPSFDFAVFESQIQPSLDRTGCTVAGCHGRDSFALFGLVPEPQPGSAEMGDNFQTVIKMIDLGTPYDNTVFYIRATDNHAGRVLDAAEEAALAAWIQDAQDISAE